MSYEVPTHSGNLSSSHLYNPESSSVVVYNFHSLYSQDRFFIFTQPSYLINNEDNSQSVSNSISSVAEIYPAAN
jgi:hypothetical protein